VDNIKKDLEETGWGGVDWIDLAQDRDKWRELVNAVMNVWIPQNVGILSRGLTIRHIVFYVANRGLKSQ
jgi:hypothetical protein